MTATTTTIIIIIIIIVTIEIHYVVQVFEITDTTEKVSSFIEKFCLPGFIPSWFKDPPLSEDEVNLLRQNNH